MNWVIQHGELVDNQHIVAYLGEIGKYLSEWMQKIFATENKDPRDIQNKNVKTSADKSVKILKSPALKKYQEIGDKAGD